jgi:hypothetical protein
MKMTTMCRSTPSRPSAAVCPRAPRNDNEPCKTHGIALGKDYEPRRTNRRRMLMRNSGVVRCFGDGVAEQNRPSLQLCRLTSFRAA